MVEEHNITQSNADKWQHIHKVLVADDDDTWCYVSVKILRKAGFEKEIITVSNGLQALNTLQKQAEAGERIPELIFLDIKMPVMNGFEFLDALTQPSGPLNISQTRIYVCSSSYNPKDKEIAYSYPIAGFLTKPLTQEMLMEIIEP